MRRPARTALAAFGFRLAASPRAGERVADVSVAPDRTVYLLMENGRYYSISGGGAPFYHGVLIPVQAVAGIAAPHPDVHPFGQLWGTSSVFGPGALCVCSTVNGWSATNLRDVVDISLAEGRVWMVKSDDTVWTTVDGQTQLRMGNQPLKRISAGISGLAWAVAADGSAWLWTAEEFQSQSPSVPPPPPPPPPPPQGAPPQISVAPSGGGATTVFLVTGLRFLPFVQVTVRGARIADGQIHQFYWTTTSDGDGRINQPITLPCVPGIVISFSANDGRPAPGDLTDRLWSNTVRATCPPV